MKNNNSTTNSTQTRSAGSNSSNHNNNNQGGSHERRRPYNQQQQQQQHQVQHEPRNNHQQQHHQSHQQQPQQFHGRRERSGQRYPSGQSNPERDTSNLGSVKFTPGHSTIELPPIETKADPNKKFTGRCRLFVGNLPHNTSEEKLRKLFEPHGEVGEVYLGPKSAFAFVKMDTRQSAEAARDALDCTMYDGRTLRVRLAAHAAAIRIKHLCPQVTNELLAYAFRYFGEIERAVVVVDDKGKSTGEGIVEYSRKQSALYAIKRCQQDNFMLTALPRPVLVEPFDQQDEDEGLPEKSINKNASDYKKERDVGPRFAEQGTFENDFALRWKELYAIEKQKRERLEQEIEEARNNLQAQIEFARLEHEGTILKNQLQALEDSKMKLQQMREQTMGGAQQHDEMRRQLDMMTRQREEADLRRQLGDPNSLTQQEQALRMQANALQNLLNSQPDQPVTEDQSDQQQQQHQQQLGSQVDADPQAMSMGQMGVPFGQMANQPTTFADAAMMGMNQPFIQVQQQIGMPQPPTQMNAPNMFTAFMNPQPQMSMTTDGDIDNSNYNSYPRTRGRAASSQQQPQDQPKQQQTTSASGSKRREKFTRQYSNPSNNISLVQPSRPPKRRRF